MKSLRSILTSLHTERVSLSASVSGIEDELLQEQASLDKLNEEVRNRALRKECGWHVGLLELPQGGNLLQPPLNIICDELYFFTLI